MKVKRFQAITTPKIDVHICIARPFVGSNFLNWSKIVFLLIVRDFIGN